MLLVIVLAVYVFNAGCRSFAPRLLLGFAAVAMIAIN